MSTYDPGADPKDPHPAHGMEILHTFILREGDLWSLDAWLGPALAIMLEKFLERSERTTQRDQWHKEMREVATDLRLIGTPEYYFKTKVRMKAEAAARKFADEIGGMWW